MGCHFHPCPRRLTECTHREGEAGAVVIMHVMPEATAAWAWRDTWFVWQAVAGGRGFVDVMRC